MRPREICRNIRHQKVAKMCGQQKERGKGEHGTTAIKEIGMRRIGKLTIVAGAIVRIPARGMANGEPDERKFRYRDGGNLFLIR